MVVVGVVQAGSFAVGGDPTANDAAFVAPLQDLTVHRAVVEAGEVNRLEAGTLRAVGSGIVTEIIARPGGSVRPSDPILAYWLEDSLYIQAWIEEDQVRYVRPGAEAEVEFPALGGIGVPARVERVLVAPDGQQRTLPGRPVSPLLPEETRFAVHLLIEEEDRPAELLPGMSAEAAITVDTSQASEELGYAREGDGGDGSAETSGRDPASNQPQ